MIERRIDGDTVLILVDNKPVMSMSERLADGAFYIGVSGELRNDVTHEFEDELMAAFSVCRRIVLDLSGLDYIASLAMKVLLSVQQIVDETEAAELVISALSETVEDTFDEAGFLDIFNVKSKKDRRRRP